MYDIEEKINFAVFPGENVLKETVGINLTRPAG